jgi:hypothetical protein
VLQRITGPDECFSVHLAGSLAWAKMIGYLVNALRLPLEHGARRFTEGDAP